MLDLFCGGGGLSLGASLSGKVQPAIGVDNDRVALNTYEANLGGLAMQGDLTSISFQNEVIARSLKQKIDLVAGGVPCQGFSLLNNHRKTNAKYTTGNSLLPKAFMRIALTIRPKLIVMEEVRTFPKDLLEQMKASLTRSGYHVKSEVLNAMNHAVPQSRNRLFLVASRRPQDLAKFPPTALERKITAGEALSRIDRGIPKSVSLSNEHWIRLREAIDPDTGRDKLLALKPTWHRAAYAIVDMSRPAPTLTTHMNAPGGGRFTIKRRGAYTIMTEQEAMALQSFPPNYVFSGSSADVYRQIGNSVPPRLALAVFESIT